MTAAGEAAVPDPGTAPAGGRPAGGDPAVDPALQLLEVSVRLGRRRVVQEVSASVAAGRWLSVVGANGAGKSTLLRAVVGLVRHEGAIRLGARDNATVTNRQRARLVTMVAQNPVLPPAMSVNAYVLLGRTAHLGPFGRESAEDLELVAQALHRLDATALAARPLRSLSGGEAQRVTIARALVQDTPLLLLDEPTSSLDIGHQLAMLDLVDELRRERGLAVLSTMHDLTLAAQYADELLLLHQGTVVAAGPPASVLCEDNLTRYYGARVRVVRDGEALVIVPLRAGPTAPMAHTPPP